MRKSHKNLKETTKYEKLKEYRRQFICFINHVLLVFFILRLMGTFNNVLKILIVQISYGGRTLELTNTGETGENEIDKMSQKFNKGNYLYVKLNTILVNIQ